MTASGKGGPLGRQGPQLLLAVRIRAFVAKCAAPLAPPGRASRPSQLRTQASPTSQGLQPTQALSRMSSTRLLF